MSRAAMRSTRMVSLGIALLWTACVSVHAWLYVESTLAHPELITEWYARSIHFQLVSFAFVFGWFWVAVLVAILFFVRRASRRHSS